MNEIDQIRWEIAELKRRVLEVPDIGAGISFPSNPYSGQTFFRTDLGFWCYYDGTRWLTAHEYHVSMPYMYNVSANATTSSPVAVARNYVPYFTKIAVVAYPNAPTDGSNYWSCRFRTVDQAYSSASPLWWPSFGPPISTGAWYFNTNAAVNTVPTYYGILDLYFDKTGNPGNINLFGSVYYRFIIT